MPFFHPSNISHSRYIIKILCSESLGLIVSFVLTVWLSIGHIIKFVFVFSYRVSLILVDFTLFSWIYKTLTWFRSQKNYEKKYTPRSPISCSTSFLPIPVGNQFHYFHLYFFLQTYFIFSSFLQNDNLLYTFFV